LTLLVGGRKSIQPVEILCHFPERFSAGMCRGRKSKGNQHSQLCLENSLIELVVVAVVVVIVVVMVVVVVVLVVVVVVVVLLLLLVVVVVVV